MLHEIILTNAVATIHAIIGDSSAINQGSPAKEDSGVVVLAYGEHEGGVEDGAVRADEAGELAVGELPEGIRRRGRRGRRGG